jgi:hypothetical protein
MNEETIHAELSVANVRAHATCIATDIPTRLAGSANGWRMAEYSADALRAAGVSAEVHELPAIVSFPEGADLRVLAPVESAIEASTLGHSIATGDEGVAGELIDVAGGGFGDYDGKDAAGKIVLSELSLPPARHEKQRIAALHGCAGAIMINWGAPESTALPFGSVKSAWGAPTEAMLRTEMPTLPCIGISREAGLRLREQRRNGPVTVWLSTHVENAWRPVQITVGEIRPPHGDEFVIVGGHQDSWFGPAATDNAAGNACVLELARVFNRHRDQLRRGIVFGFWTAHETGTMSGSAWYADRHWDRLREHAVGYLQVDQPACLDAGIWGSWSNTEMKRFHQAIERRLLGRREIAWERAGKQGDASFFGMGVPMMQGNGVYSREQLAATAGATFGWWHHTLDNTLDKIDWTDMAEHLRVYASYLWTLCTVPILPYEFVSVADELIARLQALVPMAAGVGLEGTLAQARRFRDSAQRLETAAQALRHRADAPGADFEAQACAINRGLKRLSRLLIPIQSTAIGTYGHDMYGYTPQGTMIPCLYDVARLARTPADTPERWMLETALTRERNRVTDALSDGNAVIADTLQSLQHCT